MDNDVISSNTATGTALGSAYGGGIAVISSELTPSTMIMSKTLVRQNTAYVFGGGIYFTTVDGFSGNLNILDSAIYGNQTTYTIGGRGGGLYIQAPGTANFTNTTISGNTSPDLGGGRFLYKATVSINNVTIANNTGLLGGGVYLNGTGGPPAAYSTISAMNSIIADNISTMAIPPAVPDCYAAPNNAINSQDYNLIENVIGCLIVGTTTNNITGVDPVLKALANNGGGTMTHELKVGSPAIDSANPLTCTGTDQRAVTRPRDGDNDGTSVCDIGAFERKANVITIYRSTAAYDGHVLESNETSNAGGTLDRMGTTFNLGDAAGDKQYLAILSFNTASLPDNATVVKATLKIRKQGLTGTDPFTILGALRADIRRPYFGATAGLVISDFQAVANRSAVGTFPNTPVSNWYSAVIAPAGLPFINLTGITQFRLRFSTDDNDDGAADFMKFFSGNYATVGVRPTIVIEYYVP
jgi:predicted outer membrane repeat protein